jgi:hypothetical protein
VRALSDIDIESIRSAAVSSFNDLPRLKLFLCAKEFVNRTRIESSSMCLGVEKAVTTCNVRLRVEDMHSKE